MERTPYNLDGPLGFTSSMVVVVVLLCRLVKELLPLVTAGVAIGGVTGLGFGHLLNLVLSVSSGTGDSGSSSSSSGLGGINGLHGLSFKVSSLSTLASLPILIKDHFTEFGVSADDVNVDNNSDNRADPTSNTNISQTKGKGTDEEEEHSATTPAEHEPEVSDHLLLKALPPELEQEEDTREHDDVNRGEDSNKIRTAKDVENTDNDQEESYNGAKK